MQFKRLLKITSMILWIFIVHDFQLCFSSDKSKLQMDEPQRSTTPSSWTTFISSIKNHDDDQQSKSNEESRGFRLGLLGGGSRNMTINLTNLAVLGLGMAAAVSLFSFFENPGMIIKRSMAAFEEDPLNNYISHFINYLTVVVEGRDLKDDRESLKTENTFNNWHGNEYRKMKLFIDDLKTDWKTILNRIQEILFSGKNVMQNGIEEKT